MSRFTALMIAAIGVAAAPCALAQSGEPVLVTKPQLAVAPMQRIEVSPELAAKVGRQVWLNETGGVREAITAWNTSEDFASLGIGHFIWFSKGLESRFVESFPAMIEFVRNRGAKPPAWLDVSPVPPSPWKSKREFQRAFHSEEMTSLRAFLLDTFGLQAQFLTLRLQEALPLIEQSLKEEDQRAHVREQFYRVAAASNDLYTLIDYVNFKGEGISASETFANRDTGRRQGWGLKHVLMAMRGKSKEPRVVLGEFADAARFVLLRRIANNPVDQRWQKGWMARVETYRRPLQ